MHSAKGVMKWLKDWQEQRQTGRMMKNYQKEQEQKYGKDEAKRRMEKAVKEQQQWHESQQVYDKQKQQLDDYKKGRR